MEDVVKKESQPITVIYKGGRLPSWYRLAAAQKSAFEQEHVALMLTIAAQHHLQRLDGFRLLTPQGSWERIWLIRFPTAAGAEAWIEAEMAPPYGRYGYYDYQLARPLKPAFERDHAPLPPHLSTFDGDPHQVPPLAVDRSRVVAWLFEHDQDPQPPDVTVGSLLTAGPHIQRVEGFQLLTPQADWQRAWLIELPDIAVAEAWLEASAAAGQADSTERSFQLTRPWAPAYFASWLSP